MVDLALSFLFVKTSPKMQRISSMKPQIEIYTVSNEIFFPSPLQCTFFIYQISNRDPKHDSFRHDTKLTTNVILECV